MLRIPIQYMPYAKEIAEQEVAAPRLEKIEKGNWIDVYAYKVEVNGREINRDRLPFDYSQLDTVKIYLGFSMQLPPGYEALLAPRSSTFRKWGLIQTNSMGVIDTSYRGPADEWQQEFIALRPGTINLFDKVGQFRVLKTMEPVEFMPVARFHGRNRGGYGTTGSNAAAGPGNAVNPPNNMAEGVLHHVTVNVKDNANVGPELAKAIEKIMNDDKKREALINGKF